MNETEKEIEQVELNDRATPLGLQVEGYRVYQWRSGWNKELLGELDGPKSVVAFLDGYAKGLPVVNHRKISPVDVAKAVFAKCNGWDSALSKALVEEFATEHRTLQQAFFRSVIRPVVNEMADNQQTDLRNEGSKRYAIATKEATKDVGLPLI